MTMARQPIDYFVLDAIADDIESLDDVLRAVNHPTMGWQASFGSAIRREDAVPALMRLIRDELAELYEYSDRDKSLVKLALKVQPSRQFEEYWFGITKRGKMIHDAWTPQESASSRLPNEEL